MREGSARSEKTHCHATVTHTRPIGEVKQIRVVMDYILSCLRKTYSVLYLGLPLACYRKLEQNVTCSTSSDKTNYPSVQSIVSLGQEHASKSSRSITSPRPPTHDPPTSFS